jgi:two-component system response regulator PhoP
MRILIVEDEKLICEQLRRYFVDKGFAVDVAHNATDGEYMAKE